MFFLIYSIDDYCRYCDHRLEFIHLLFFHYISVYNTAVQKKVEWRVLNGGSGAILFISETQGEQ